MKDTYAQILKLIFAPIRYPLRILARKFVYANNSKSKEREINSLN